MIISSKVYLPFPRPLVYTTYRDKLIELLPYLPDINHIEIKSCRQEQGLTHFVNEWQGGGEIPLFARAVLSDAMLSWTDYATWNAADFTTDWRTETHAFTQAVHCLGKNRFLEQGSGTAIASEGSLTIDPKKITGMPQFLTGKVAQTAEDFLSKKIEQTSIQISQGIQRYLEQLHKS